MVATASLLALTACTPSVPGDGDSGDTDTLTLLLTDSVDSIDPVLATSLAGRQVTWLTYESLVRVDPETGEAAPGLAEEFSYDATSAHFVIREGALCADGSEITAGTVARNFERWQDPDTNAPLVDAQFGSADFTVEFDDEARTVDVEMTTPKPFRSVSPAFTTLGIICDSGLENPDSLETTSDGTAPYRISEYVVGSHVTLTRNDDYAWAPIDDFDIEELPTTVTLNIVSDADTQVNLLLGGDADGALLSSAQLERLADSDFTTQLSSTDPSLLLFNENEGFAASDVAVRQALTQAIDFTELADVQGQGAYAYDLLRSADGACLDEDAMVEARPTGGIEAAQQTLEDAGYTKNADGIYEKDGTPISMTLLGMELTSAATELIMSNWTEVGVDVTIDDRASSQATDVLFSGAGWDAAIVGLSTTMPTDLVGFIAGPAAPEGPNFGAINNTTYLPLMGQASSMEGLTGCDLWIQAEAALVADADMVPAFATDSEWALAPGVEFFNSSSQIDPLTLRKN
ncbi:MAG: ABC transporter substrate-binding protein [Microbacterium sp.]